MIDYEMIAQAAKEQKPGTQFKWKGKTYLRCIEDQHGSYGWVCVETGEPVHHFSMLVSENGDNPFIPAPHTILGQGDYEKRLTD